MLFYVPQGLPLPHFDAFFLAAPEPNANAAVRAVWQDAVLGLRPDGTFQIYAWAAIDGRYEVVGNKLKLHLKVLFDRPVTAEAKSVDLLGLSLTWKGGEFVSSSKSAPMDRIHFRPMPAKSADAWLDLWNTPGGTLTPQMSLAYDVLTRNAAKFAPELVRIATARDHRMTWVSVGTFLGKAHTGDSRAAIRAWLKSGNKWANRAASRALDGDPLAVSEAELMEAWKAKKIDLYDLSNALGRCGSSLGAAALVTTLDKPEPFVVAALGRLKYRPALNRIRQLANQKGSEVQTAAAFAILKIDPSPANRRRFLPVLRDRVVSSDFMVAIDAIKYLEELKDQGSVPNLIGATQSPNSLVRMWSARVLGHMKVRESRYILLKLIHDEDNQVARAAAEALEQLPPK